MANTPNIIGSPCRVHRLFEYDRLLLALKGSALHPVLSIKTGIWLLWPLLTSARSPYKLSHKALPYKNLGRTLGTSLTKWIYYDIGTAVILR